MNHTYSFSSEEFQEMVLALRAHIFKLEGERKGATSISFRADLDAYIASSKSAMQKMVAA
jgi:hypothetical protein